MSVQIGVFNSQISYVSKFQYRLNIIFIRIIYLWIIDIWYALIFDINGKSGIFNLQSFRAKKTFYDERFFVFDSRASPNVHAKNSS